ncbi:MAG: VCBS repeat-containing protein [Myxococcales bacterium]|nr:VCBS repeat-containing protein [Myxococcales bacterium]
MKALPVHVLRSYGTGTTFLLTAVALAALGCGNKDQPEALGKGSLAPTTGTGPAAPSETKEPASAKGVPADLPSGLLLAYAQFETEGGKVLPKPGPARVELLTRTKGTWSIDVIEDPESNVFHKAMVFSPPDAEPGILTLGGNQAILKLWNRDSTGHFRAKTLWKESFGGKFDRMRDAEIGVLYGDGGTTIAVATHDQGVVATVRAKGGSYQVDQLDRQKDTFIHEIELGDLDGDGVQEIYATPSEPNRLEGGAQHGEVVRYIPGKGEGRTVVADLGDRHAKEIYVGDVDGDKVDELYVAVEALTKGKGGAELVEPVEIRRYDHGTDPKKGVVIATISDRLCRFLTVGDVDGDGKKEMVAAAFSSGLWMLRPGKNPKGEWAIESIDRDSSGFEHAALLTDLDADGRDELYVAADEQGEVRQYVWNRGRPTRTTIHKRDIPRSRMTWNIMPAPTPLLIHEP